MPKGIPNNRVFHHNHKLIMKFMKQMGLCSKVRMKKYRSYKGEVGKITSDRRERDFHAEKEIPCFHRRGMV